jgi:hypothetical protein
MRRAITIIGLMLLSLLPRLAWADCVGNKGAQHLLGAGVRYQLSEDCFLNSGWFPPVPVVNGVIETSTNFDYEAPSYPANNGVTWSHGGVDMAGPISNPYTFTTSVFAIGRGVVKYINRIPSQDNSSNMSVIVVEHENASGVKFLALYGHTLAESALAVNQTVQRGQNIGTLMRYGSPIHLHLSIYPNYTWPAGRAAFGSDTDTVEPVQYLVNNAGSLVPRAFVDGVGSLIDPKNGGTCIASLANYGCSRDEIKLHPHPIPSAGSFQVYSDTNGGCDYVTLSGLTKAHIAIRRWNEAYPGPLEYATPPVSTIYTAGQLPVHLKVPYGFSLVYVTTTQPVPAGETRSLTLECKSGALPVTSLLVDIAPTVAKRAGSPTAMYTMVSGDKNRYWGGNGSIIPPSGNNYAGEFGRIKDYAKTQSIGYSEVMFQVYTAANCRNVRISASSGTVSADIAMKPWNVSPWSEIGADLPLPYVIQVQSTGYQLFRVRPGSSGNFRIVAACA